MLSGQKRKRKQPIQVDGNNFQAALIGVRKGDYSKFIDLYKDEEKLYLDLSIYSSVSAAFYPQLANALLQTKITSLSIVFGKFATDDPGNNPLAVREFASNLQNIRKLTIDGDTSGMVRTWVAIGLKKNPNLKKLYLRGWEKSEDQIKAFFNALSETSIESFKFYEQNLSESDVEVLAKYIQGNFTLRTLILHSNSINSIGALAIARSLAHTNINDLDLSWNAIDIDGAIKLVQLLAQTSVYHLNISQNEDITHEAGDLIAPFIRDTQIVKIDITFDDLQVPDDEEEYDKLIAEKGIEWDKAELKLTQSIAHNCARLALTPYYASLLKFLPESEKAKHRKLPLESLANENEKLRFACGILMDLPRDIINKVLSFLPLMRTKRGLSQIGKYNAIALKREHKVTCLK